MSGDDLLSIVRRVAGAARSGEEIEAYVLRTRETDIEIFGGEVESLTTAGVQGIGIRVITDHRQGYASAGTLDDSVIDETLQEARDNATFGAPDEWYGLATPADVNGSGAADLDLWRDDVGATSTDDKVKLALDVEAATRARDARIRGVEAAGYGDALGESALANSHGVESATRRTTASIYAVALADDGTGVQTGYGLSAGRAIADLDAEEVVHDAVDRACRLLGAKPVTGRRLPVILDPLVTRSFLGVLSSAFDGDAALKGRSLFANREGETVASPVFDLVDDPTDARAFGATQYDSEGIPARRNPLIVDGVFQTFLQNVYTGRRAGRATTASAVRGGYGTTPGVGVRALVLRPGSRSVDEVLASVPEAFYVQSVSGLHSGTNPISGDFSVGAEGLMVRNGTLAEPVREVTIASTLQRMLLDVADVANDLRYLPGAATGATVLIGEMTLSGA